MERIKRTKSTLEELQEVEQHWKTLSPEEKYDESKLEDFLDLANRSDSELADADAFCSINFPQEEGGLSKDSSEECAFLLYCSCLFRKELKKRKGTFPAFYSLSYLYRFWEDHGIRRSVDNTGLKDRVIDALAVPLRNDMELRDIYDLARSYLLTKGFPSSERLECFATIEKVLNDECLKRGLSQLNNG